MRSGKSVEQLDAEFRAQAKAVAGKTTKRAQMLKERDYSIRFSAEKARVQRHYCTLFGFWRSCKLKPCRRARACGGDADACLRRSVDRVPRTELRQAQTNLLEATPHHIGRAELKVRQTWPTDFWRRPVNPAWKEALAHAKEKREDEKRFGIRVERD